MDFIDYYAVLGVPKTATEAEIDSAYRKLARQYHPDVNKAKDAEEKFKQIGEAYEVLKDPAKRQRYDTYGAAWKDAQQRGAPPPGFDGFRSAPPGGSGEDFEFHFGGGTDFSDFFRELFGMGGMGGFGGAPTGGRTRRGGGRRIAGIDQEASIALSLADAARGGRRQITLRDPRSGRDRTLAVQIPRGVRSGQRIRLAGQGEPASGGAPAGHLYLHVEIEPDPNFVLDGDDLYTVLHVTPWTAALGGEALLRTLDGTVKVKVPAGSPSGRQIRLAGKGFPNGHGAGNLYAEIRIVVPQVLSAEERELFEKLAQVSKFTPPGQQARGPAEASRGA